jgi:putative restriction endonuclease
MKRAWSCITLGSDRQYGGNSGYKDDLSRHYEYDSNVANHRNVSEGDLIVLRDRAQGIGVAQIAKIETAPGHKLINRCPECGTTGIKARKSKSPLYRCNSGHEFDVPRSADEPVTIYRALFESFLALQAPIPVARLKAMAPRQSDQLSIEELDLSELEAAFGSLGEPAARLSQAAAARSTIGTQEADDNSTFLAPMTSADLRNLVLRAIKVRRGQAKFRKDLLRRYGNRCLVTGCNVEALLEAAHIAPYRNDTHNHVRRQMI